MDSQRLPDSRGETVGQRGELPSTSSAELVDRARLGDTRAAVAAV
jgi:hypothetical protein